MQNIQSVSCGEDCCLVDYYQYAQDYEQNRKHDSRQKEKLFEAAFCMKILHAVAARNSAANTRSRRLEENCCYEEAGNENLCCGQNFF